MTPSDWAASTDPQPMLSFLGARGPVNHRKLRLFALACCRRLWPWMSDERSRLAVEVAERDIDGRAGAAEVKTVGLAASYAATDTGGQTNAGRAALAAFITIARVDEFTPENMGLFLRMTGPDTDAGTDAPDESAASAAALRDIFGDPFSPFTFLPEWRTEAVVSLARGIYEEGAWERLVVLADALDDAGCDSAEMVRHCREPGGHVKGCWAVDLVLGKT